MAKRARKTASTETGDALAQLRAIDEEIAKRETWLQDARRVIIDDLKLDTEMQGLRPEYVNAFQAHEQLPHEIATLHRKGDDIAERLAKSHWDVLKLVLKRRSREVEEKLIQLIAPGLLLMLTPVIVERIEQVMKTKKARRAPAAEAPAPDTKRTRNKRADVG